MKIQDVPGIALDLGKSIAGCAVGLVGAAAAVTLIPVVSLVALPILGIKAAITKLQYNFLFNKTVTDCTRQPFGRIAGQDYTRWDGKSTNETQTEKLIYKHGHEDMHVLQANIQAIDAADNPFKTIEDAKWLTLEAARREKLDSLMDQLDRIKLVAKCIIPIVGLVWVFPDLKWHPINYADTRFKEEWGWKAAITFHQESLARRLA